MHWIDWCITVIPVVIILGLGFYSRKYVRGVVDFLVAGRVAGRYVIAAGDLQAGLSIITLVATTEAACQTGFSVGFWGTLFAPIGIVLGLTGFCTYRFRETKAMSFGQFLEMRYNRTFRIFAATLRTISEMVTNAIGPAIAANFFIYFLNLPHRIYIFNMPIPCFALVVGGVLIMAMVVIWPAGRISLLITDCFQGIMGYPIFVMMIGYVLVTFSWFDEMAPVLMDRVPGQSFLNPFDIAELRDFNIFASIVMIVGSVLNRASWFGNDTSGCARTPHEQKMAGVLGYWRNGFAFTMCTFISAIVITVSVSDRFADKAHDIRQQLSVHVTDEVFGNNPAVKNQIDKKISQLPVQHHRIGVDAPMSQEHNGNTIYFDTVKSSLGDSGKANYDFQQYRTLFQQMIMPITLRNMLPVGLIGVFC
ncbi:MAG: hypothetical protein PHI35_08910, partial [Victivallaceae bacterium]|nr:hypothetical protein [Victivallaceae bacterium]